MSAFKQHFDIMMTAHLLHLRDQCYDSRTSVLILQTKARTEQQNIT
jgi:hypothetical protein